MFPYLNAVCGYIPSESERRKFKNCLSVKHHFPELNKLTAGVPATMRIIVPLQSSLTVTLPPPASNLTLSNRIGTARQNNTNSSAVASSNRRSAGGNISSEQEVDYTSFKFFSDHLPTIHQFEDTIDVLRSKEKPKKLVMRGSDGLLYAFLAKREVTGDMRKNSRMMDIAVVINRLLKKDPESRRRKLHVRTYAVIPITEESGLIEWVPNTTGFRHLTKALHDQLGIPGDFSAPRAMQERATAEMMLIHDQAGKDLRELQLYREWRAYFPVVFHRWFMIAFGEPSQWFAARTLFTRSCAVWSMVGFMVGLGDRHGENILIDETNGECVHVDFDCLFNV